MVKSLMQLMEESRLEKAEKEKQAIEDILVILPKGVLDRCGIVLESQWVEHKSGWAYRVDPENPSIPLQRHVHISKTKNKSVKDLQVSWNVDGSRHDKKSFNVDLSRQTYVRDLAREVLKLDSTTVLEDMNQTRSAVLHCQPPLFSSDGKNALVSFTFDLAESGS